MKLGNFLPRKLGDEAYRLKMKALRKLRPPPADTTVATDREVTVEGETFRNCRESIASKGMGRNLLGFTEKSVLKVEEEPWELKRNSLDQEIAILRKLNRAGVRCAPTVLSDGTTEDGQRYMVMERIEAPAGGPSVTDPPPADVLLAFLECKGAGIIHGDLRKTNYLWNGQHAVLLDFDQAIEDDKVVPMTFNEVCEYMQDMYPESEHRCGTMQEQIKRLRWRDYCVNGKLDLAHTSLMQAEKSTNTTNGIYHSLDDRCTFVEGERGLGARRVILDAIPDFAGESILDIGCNTGLLVRYLASRGATQVDGYEIIAPHALLGDIVNHCSGMFNAHIESRDLSTAGIDRNYNTIMLFSVLHHIDDMEHAITEIRNHCDRVIIECRLKEYGQRYDTETKQWVDTNAWNFETLDELTAYLSETFGFAFTKNYGAVDRNRSILEFRR